MYSLLELTPKSDVGFQKIHNVFFQPGFYVNNGISKKAVHLCYTTLDNLLPKFVAARYHCVIIKRDIKDVFIIFLRCRMSDSSLSSVGDCAFIRKTVYFLDSQHCFSSLTNLQKLFIESYNPS